MSSGVEHREEAAYAPARHYRLLLASVGDLGHDRLEVVEVVVDGDAGEVRRQAATVAAQVDDDRLPAESLELLAPGVRNGDADRALLDQ